MVLIFSLENAVQGLAEALKADGYEVKVSTKGWAGWPLSKEDTEGATIIYNNMVALEIPEGDYLVISPSRAAARLELCKWETRWKAEKVGFKLPRVLAECSMKTERTFTDTVYLKSKFQDSAHCAWKIPPGFSIPRLGYPNMPGYIEEDIKPDMSAKCRFTIANGKYQIEHLSGHTYDGEDKFHDTIFLNWPELGEWVKLPDEKKFLDLCTRWLDYAVTLGGNYSGEIEAGVKGDDIYWYEQNCRRISNGHFHGSGQTWLDSLTIDPAKALEVEWLY